MKVERMANYSELLTLKIMTNMIKQRNKIDRLNLITSIDFCARGIDEQIDRKKAA